MPVGKVKWFNTEKGYGFIEPDNGGDDVFIHVTGLVDAGIDAVSEGQRVEFDMGTNSRTQKSKAINLRLV